eukprot:836946_1
MGAWWFYPTENEVISTEYNNVLDNIEKQSPIQEDMSMEPIPIDISSRTSTPNRSRTYNIDDVLNDKSCNNDREYSASAASSGSGFHGETAILGKTFEDNTCLPTDAHQIIDLIQQYLAKIKLDENVMSVLSNSDKKFMDDVWDVKLKDNLNNLIQNNMSKHAYDALIEIFDALKANDYDIANKKIAKIARNRREFIVNKKW